MKTSPSVSVVMPTFNRSHLISQVIASILEQDYADLELLIIDDGSSDETGKVVGRMQERDVRLRYLPLTANRGIGFARDVGFRHAKGRYIALADSDDVWMSGRLQKQIDVLEAFPEIDILFGDSYNINHKRGTETRAFTVYAELMKNLVVERLGKDLFLITSGMEIAVTRSNFVPTPTIVLRRDVLDRVGGFNNCLSRTSELEFHCRAALFGARFAYLNRPLIQRHLYSDNVTAQSYHIWEHRLKSLEICRWHCQKYELDYLHKHVRASIMRSHRNIVRIHGQNRKRRLAILAYLKSISSGFSLRTMIMLVLAILGPWWISKLMWIRSNDWRSDH